MASSQDLTKSLEDIRLRPAAHRHDYAGLMACCTTADGICPSLLAAHAEALNLRNGGSDCDVVEGPCACGAWHSLDDLPERLRHAK
jgi:hypothetical protein